MQHYHHNLGKMDKNIQSANPRISALILAAGLSRRAGNANKLLKLLHNKPLLQHSVDMLKHVDLQRTLVITGHEHSQIITAVDLQSCDIRYNPHYRNGMASSLVLGIKSLKDAEAVVVCLGDMPHVPASVVTKLIEAFNATAGKSIFIPVHQHQPGNPVLLSQAVFNDVLQLTEDKGVRALRTSHAESIVWVNVHSKGILQDYDTEADFDGIRF